MEFFPTFDTDTFGGGLVVGKNQSITESENPSKKKFSF
jgi:hypothetical protein